jgi:hypothetical protein
MSILKVVGDDDVWVVSGGRGCDNQRVSRF